MKPEITLSEQELLKCLGELLRRSLTLSRPVESLHQIREKIYTRGYQEFDGEDILGELGRLEGLLWELHGTMLRISDSVKQYNVKQDDVKQPRPWS